MRTQYWTLTISYFLAFFVQSCCPVMGGPPVQEKTLVSFPFQVPHDVSFVAGVTDLEQIRRLLPKQSDWLRLFELLANTDPHDGGVITPALSEIGEFSDSPETAGGRSAFPVSVWVVLDDHEKQVGEGALVISHPGRILGEDEQEKVRALSKSGVAFLARQFRASTMPHGARLYEALSRWEHNHTCVFADGITIVATSDAFAASLKGSENGTDDRGNRSFREACSRSLVDADLVVFVAPPRIRSAALGIGYVAAEYWEKANYGEMPWSVYSARLGTRNQTTIDYRWVTKTTLPLTGRNRYWNSWRPLEWTPKFPGHFRRISGSNRDLVLYDEMAREPGTHSRRQLCDTTAKRAIQDSIKKRFVKPQRPLFDFVTCHAPVSCNQSCSCCGNLRYP